MITLDDLTPDQAAALQRIIAWFGGIEARHAPLTLGGYAGTGKTTLLGLLPAALNGADRGEVRVPWSPRIRYVSYTGKAVSVLRRKLPPGSDVSTIHRLLYHPRQRIVCKKTEEDCDPGNWCPTHTPTWDPEVEGAPPPPEPCTTVRKLDWSEQMNPLNGIDLVVVDEASMVSDKIWRDLTKWNVPVLAVGDHGQLPPVKSEFNLMQDPEIKLETILRQVADSPIIKAATMARTRGRIPFGIIGPGAKKVPRQRLSHIPLDPGPDEAIICGYNRTRNDMNSAIRQAHGRKGPPAVGDVVICLRNSYEQGIFNGMRGRILEVEPDPYNDMTAMAAIEMFDEGFTFYGKIALKQFGEPKTLSTLPRQWALFDYGYAVTCHKAQGSEFQRVLVVEERLPWSQHSRWLYTATTRASDKLIVVE